MDDFCCENLTSVSRGQDGTGECGLGLEPEPGMATHLRMRCLQCKWRADRDCCFDSMHVLRENVALAGCYSAGQAHELSEVLAHACVDDIEERPADDTNIIGVPAAVGIHCGCVDVWLRDESFDCC